MIGRATALKGANVPLLLNPQRPFITDLIGRTPLWKSIPGIKSYVRYDNHILMFCSLYNVFFSHGFLFDFGFRLVKICKAINIINLLNLKVDYTYVQCLSYIV